jgi:hypothetical protein
MAREAVRKEDLAFMLRNDKKAQQTHLVATLAAKMPNGREYTVTDVGYPTALIPKDSVVGTVYPVITEAFDAGATFDVGTTADPKCFAEAVNGAAVTTAISVTNYNKWFPVDTEVIITPHYTGDNEKGRISVMLELFELEASIGRYTR